MILSQAFALLEKLFASVMIYGLFDTIGVQHVSKEWRLFIDSPTTSLKAVLLYNGNKLPTIFLTHSVKLRELLQCKISLTISSIHRIKLGNHLGFQGGNFSAWISMRIYQVLMLSLF